MIDFVMWFRPLCNLLTHQDIFMKLQNKFYQGIRKIVLVLGQDLIRILVSMTEDSSHRGLRGQTMSPLFSVLSDFILSGNDEMHEITDEFELRPDPSWLPLAV